MGSDKRSNVGFVKYKYTKFYINIEEKFYLYCAKIKNLGELDLVRTGTFEAGWYWLILSVALRAILEQK